MKLSLCSTLAIIGVLLFPLVASAPAAPGNAARNKRFRKMAAIGNLRMMVSEVARELRGDVTETVLEELLPYYNNHTKTIQELTKDFHTAKRQWRKQYDEAENEIDSLKHQVENLSSLVENLTSQLTVGQLQREEDQPLQWNQPADGPETDASIDGPNSTNQLATLEPKDCEDLLSIGQPKSGVYRIYPHQSEPFDVFCEFENQSAWTVIQRRVDGSVDFFQSWNEYKQGFGAKTGEHWLGNEWIYRLTSQASYRLRIDLWDWSARLYRAEYEHFSIGPESDLYRLHVGDYRTDLSTAGDALTAQWESHNGLPFSTWDRDNDNRFYDNCAQHYHGAWWFNSCFQSHLNGIYYREGAHDNYFIRDGIQWNTISFYTSLKGTRVSVQRNHVSNTVPIK